MKQFSTAILSLLLALVLATGVTAQETTTNTTTPETIGSSPQLDNPLSATESFGDTVTVDEQFKTRVFEVFDSLENADATALNGISLLTPVVASNTSALNQRFSVLYSGMESMGYGKTTELNIPEFNTGYSVDLKSRFTELYGDVSANYQTNMTLPEGLSMSSIMEGYTGIRDELALSAQSTPMFTETKNAISIGAIFDAAKEEKSLPSFKDAASELKQSVHGWVDDQYNANVTESNKYGQDQASNWSEQNTSAYDDTWEMFDEFVLAAKDRIDPYQTWIADTFDIWYSE